MKDYLIAQHLPKESGQHVRHGEQLDIQDIGSLPLLLFQNLPECADITKRMLADSWNKQNPTTSSFYPVTIHTGVTVYDIVKDGVAAHVFVHIQDKSLNATEDFT